MAFQTGRTQRGYSEPAPEVALIESDSRSKSQTADFDALLKCGRKGAIPGKGFKAKVAGKWRDYAPPCNSLLIEAYEAGCPSMRLNVKGHMIKFDFEAMEQRNLSTLEVNEMKAPHDLDRPRKSSIFKMENLLHPRSKGIKHCIIDCPTVALESTSLTFMFTHVWRRACSIVSIQVGSNVLRR